MMKQIESALWDLWTVEEDGVERLTSTPENDEWYVR
jgi:hypothetical protein